MRLCVSSCYSKNVLSNRVNPLLPREESFMVMKGGEEMAIEESYLVEFTGAE
jgi:hypothetical protein